MLFFDINVYRLVNDFVLYCVVFFFKFIDDEMFFVCSVFVWCCIFFGLWCGGCVMLCGIGGFEDGVVGGVCGGCVY